MAGEAAKVDLRPCEEILGRHPADPAALISVLQDIQLAYRYLPGEALRLVAGRLSVPLSKVASVATFYTAFSLVPKGRQVIRVCMGTACHVRGAALLLDEFQRRLGVEPGGTTPDQEFTLERVNCVGTCAMAPVVMVGDAYHGNMRIGRVARLAGQKVRG